LAATGQPTQQILETRRPAEFITPIPKPKKRKKAPKQEEMVFDEGKGLSTKEAAVRPHLDHQRGARPSTPGAPAQSQPVAGHARDRAPAAALAAPQVQRHVRPFFCQVEAVETAIWLTEVAPQPSTASASSTTWQRQQGRQPRADAPGLKLATGAGKTTVMAMLIAWQTINAVRRPTSKHFTRGFLIVRPGPHHQGPPARPAAQRPGQLLQRPRTRAQRHARRHEAAPRSSSPTTTPSSCASASTVQGRAPAAAGPHGRAT
jgi:type III restriction enzyme